MHFRINSLKISEDKLLAGLKNYPEQPVLSATVNSKNIFTAPDFLGKSFEHSLGLLYIQSLASMLPPLILNPSDNDAVLDMTAAPGSKTTLLCELMKNRGIIVANEISLERAKTLQHNLDRIGSLNCLVINLNAIRLKDYFIAKFDKILLDPPCSALGSFQESSASRHKVNLNRLNNLTEIQFKLLNSASHFLKPGGELVYSTCTTTREENEEMIKKFISSNPFIVVDIFSSSDFVFQNYFPNENNLLPGTLRIDSDEWQSEKFFIAKLKKIDETEVHKSLINTKKNNLVHSFSSKEIIPVLTSLSENYGIEYTFWNSFYFILGKENLYSINRTDLDLTELPYQRIGMKIASFDYKTDWRLTSNAVQIFKENIKKNIIHLNKKEDLISYYNGQTSDTDYADNNFAVVKYRDLFIGTGKIRNRKLLSQYPKARRMSQVDFTFFN